MRKVVRKIFIYLPFLLIAVIGLLYFVLTTGFCLKHVVLPLTGHLIGMPIKVEEVNASFLINQHLDVKGLTFGYSENPFIKGKKVSARFDLLTLLKGDLKLANVSIDGLDVNMTADKSGKWNVYWMNDDEPSSSVEKNGSGKAETSPSIPMQVDIAGASIRNVNYTLDTGDIKIVLKNFNIYSDSFRNQQDSSVKIKGDIEQFSGKNVTVNNGKINTNIKVNLNKDYFPTLLQLESAISEFTGVIKGKTITGNLFKINALLDPEESNNVVNISNISINGYTGNTLSASLTLNGRVVLNPFAFSLNINADPIGSDTINLLSNSLLHTGMGDDASLKFKGKLSLENNLFAVNGDLKLVDMLLVPAISASKNELVSVALKYDFSTDFSAKKADIRQLEVSVYRKDMVLIDMSLQKPVNASWGAQQFKITGQDPEIIAKISGLKLKAFNEFLPSDSNFTSGTLNSNLKLKVGDNGANISMFGNVNLSDASFVSPDCNVKGVNLNQAVTFNLRDFKNLSLKKYNMNLSQSGQKLLELSLDGKYDMDSGDGELELSIPYYSLAVINFISDGTMSKQEKRQVASIISPFNFVINNKQSFNIKKKAITLKDFLLGLKTKKNEEVSIVSDRPLKLDFNNEKLISESMSFKVKIDNFESKNLNGFFPASTRADNGKINMNATVDAANMFKSVSTSGTLNITGADIKIDGTSISKSDINSLFDASLENNLLKINKFSISTQTKLGEKVSVGLTEPAVIDLKNNRNSEDRVAFNISIESLDLSGLNGFLPEDTKFQKGRLNLKTDIVAEKNFKKFSASGTAMAANVSGKVKGNTLDKTGVLTNFNGVYNNAGPFTLNDTLVKIFYENKDAANISVNGTLNSSTGVTSLDTQFKANESLLKALNKTKSDYGKISGFLMEGNLKLKIAKNVFAIDGNINVPQLTIVDNQQAIQAEQINGALDISIYKNMQALNINSAKLNLFSNNSNICDLSGQGKIVFSDDVQSTLNISSEKIDLDKVLHIYDLLFPAAHKPGGTDESGTAQDQAKEPAPIDLQGINLTGTINFKDIQYGPYIHMDIASNLIIKDNIIALLPLIVSMNRGELKSNIYVNPSFSDGYTYEVKGQLQNLDINPLQKTFIEGDYKDTRGTISFLQCNATGKGIMGQNLLNNINGELAAKCNNISLPLDISKNKFLALFLTPIQIISNISQQLPNTPLPSNLNQAMNLTGNIMSQRKNINLQTGDILLRAGNGVVNVEKFYFEGDDLIKTMKFKGTIGPNNVLNLKTNTNFGALDIPLNLGGTVESPKPDIPAFVAGFITKNTINIIGVTQDILNNASGPQGGGPAQQLTNGVLNATKNILDNLTGQ